MKKIVNLFAVVAAVAMPLVSCQKEVADPTDNAVHITVVADGTDLKDALTKTYLVEVGDEQSGIRREVRWGDGENITLWEFVGGAYKQKANSNGCEITDNRTVASFEVPLSSLDVDPGSEFVYSAIYPADAVEYRKDGDFYRFGIPASQQVVLDSETPNMGNMDPAADVLIGKPVVRTTRPMDSEKLAFQFKRPGTIGKLTVKGITSGEVINKVTITAPINIVGYSKLNLTTAQTYDLGYSGSKSIELNVSNPEGDSMTAIEGIPCIFYFRCLAGTWASGSKVTINVDTDKATYKKTSTLSEDYVFYEGGLTAFTFNVSGSRQEFSSDSYNLVTNLDELTVGSNVIIVAKDFDYALSTQQNTNNRGQVEVTKNGNTITNLSANAQVLTLEKGTKQKTASFNTGSGYLYAASSSSNYLKTQKDKSDNSSFSIEITEGAANIIAQGTNTHNIIRYYSTSGLFACYASDQKAVVIYKKVGSGTSEKIFASGAVSQP